MNEPFIERADRHLAPDCRIESGTTPPAAARRDLHIDEQAIDGGGADSQDTITVRLAKLQSAMLLEGRQQGRDHHLEPLAAHPIRRLPQRRQRVLDRRAISASSLSCCLDLTRSNRLASPERPHRMLAMPTRRRAHFVEDTLLEQPGARLLRGRHGRPWRHVGGFATEIVAGWRYTMGGGLAGYDYAMRASMAANLTGANVLEEILKNAQH
jgi:hypothetical protein